MQLDGIRNVSGYDDLCPVPLQHSVILVPPLFFLVCFSHIPGNLITPLTEVLLLPTMLPTCKTYQTADQNRVMVTLAIMYVCGTYSSGPRDLGNGFYKLLHMRQF